MDYVHELVKKIKELKPIPQVAHKVMSIINNPDSSMEELAEVIKFDSSLTANLLKIANSAYFGRARKFDSIHQATVFLGMDQVMNIVLLASSSENLQSAQKGYGLDNGELWKHAVFSAVIAQDLCKLQNVKENHLIFTAALIKDIGKVVLNQHVQNLFEEISTLVSEKNYSFREAEKKIIGLDHAELGAMVAEKWQFSPKMVEIIKNHHTPQMSTGSKFETFVVYMADTICMMMGMGGGSDGLAYRFHEEAIDYLKIKEKDLQEIIAGFGEKAKQIESLVNFY